MNHNLKAPEGHEYFVFDDSLYLRRKSGLEQDSADQLGYDTPPKRMTTLRTGSLARKNAACGKATTGYGSRKPEATPSARLPRRT